MDLNESISGIVSSQSRSNSFLSIFREQQLQIKRLQKQLSAVKQQNGELSGENTQLKLAIAATQNNPLDSANNVHKQRYRSAPFTTH